MEQNRITKKSWRKIANEKISQEMYFGWNYERDQLKRERRKQDLRWYKRLVKDWTMSDVERVGELLRHRKECDSEVFSQQFYQVIYPLLGNPVFRNGTPISAVSRDDVEEFSDFGLLLGVEKDGLSLAVVRVDVVDLVYLLRQEACSVQRYPGSGVLEDTFQLQHDRVGDEANAYVGLDSVEEPVVHRPDVQVGLAEAESPLYHEQVSVFLDDSVIRQRAVGRVALVSVQPFILCDLVVVDLDGGVATHGKEAVVTAVVQLVLRKFVRPEAFLKPFEAPFAVCGVLPRTGIAHCHDHTPGLGDLEAGALPIGQPQSGNLILELFALGTYPCTEDVLVSTFLKVTDVLLAQKAGIGHDYRFGEAEALLQLLDDGDHRMALVGVAGMDLVPYRIASGADQQAQDHLRIGILAVLGPARDTDVILAGLEVHRGRVIEDYGYSATKNTFGLFVGYLFNIVLDIVCFGFALGLRPPTELVQIAIDLVLIVVLVHEVRHVTECLQFATRAV